MRTNFQMTDENITMVQGDTLSFNVIIKDQNGDPVDVDQASFTIKEDFNSLLPTVQLNLTAGGGITQDDGVLTVRMDPYKTLYEPSNVDVKGFFYYDMSIKINSDVFTLLRGMIQIEPHI